MNPIALYRICTFIVPFAATLATSVDLFSNFLHTGADVSGIVPAANGLNPITKVISFLPVMLGVGLGKLLPLPNRNCSVVKVIIKDNHYIYEFGEGFALFSMVMLIKVAILLTQAFIVWNCAVFMFKVINFGIDYFTLKSAEQKTLIDNTNTVQRDFRGRKID
jgi:hypothetical protein